VAELEESGNMKVSAITMRELQIPLKQFFETSFGRVTHRRIFLVTLDCEGVEGWGECVAGEGPFFSYEWIETAWVTIREFLAPALLGSTLEGAAHSGRLMGRIRGHNMAKAGLGKRPVGCGGKAEEAASVEIACGHASRGLKWSFDRHSGFARAVARKDSSRTRRRLPANQGEGQTGVGHRRARENPRALAQHSSQLRCQFRVPAERS